MVMHFIYFVIFLTVIKKELANVDVLVCGMCHVGFHFVEEFQEHKIGGSCKKISAFREQNTTVFILSILFIFNWDIYTYLFNLKIH